MLNFLALLICLKTNILFAEESLLLNSQVEVISTSSSLQYYEGTVQGVLFDTILRDTGNEAWAQTMKDIFKDDLFLSDNPKADGAYYFETSVDSKITYAKLIVNNALVEKVAQFSPETGNVQWVPKAPENEFLEFLLPVKSESISSHFHLARRHPVKRKKIQAHRGVDFRAKSGTPVFPSLDGVVVAMGRAVAKGKYILIEHSNGMKTTYDHLKKFTKGLRVGDAVSVDQEIGEVGRTGFATGAHLHFGLINQDGHYVNPIHYLKDLNPKQSQGPLEEVQGEDFNDHLIESQIETLSSDVTYAMNIFLNVAR